MAEVNINLKKLHNASTMFSSKEYAFTNIRRTTNLLRWKLPEDVTKRKDIGRRLETVLQQIKAAEQLMHEIKTTTNSCILQYVQAENKITSNAEKLDGK